MDSGDGTMYAGVYGAYMVKEELQREKLRRRTGMRAWSTKRSWEREGTG